MGSKIHSPQKKYFLLFLNTVLARQLPSLRKEQQLSTQQSLNSCIFPIACWGTRGQENNPLKCLSNALSLKETRVLSLASGMFAIHGGSRRRTEERARRGGERGGRTCCAVAVPQEMQLCSVCLLTKMSNACLVLGNFHIPFRDLTALCLMVEELPEVLEVQIFFFFFPL